MTRTRSNAIVGAIEAGGTKFVCAVGTGPDDFVRSEFPTGVEPDRVVSNVTEWLSRQQETSGALEAIGIGTFGPTDLDPSLPTYGFITSTPKSGWRDTDMLGSIRKAFPDTPFAFDTDVNVAALGESYWGCAAGLDDVIYVTIGTGIGMGGLVNGRLMHGLMHPEVGHMLLPRIEGDLFPGNCPIHGACWEGLCSGSALRDRTGIPAGELPAEHEAWPIAVRYVALGLVNIVYVLSPRRVIVGGSVRKAGGLGETAFFRLLREEFQRAENGYLTATELGRDIGDFIVPPALGDDAGVLGAIALAQELLAEQVPDSNPGVARA